MYLSWIVFIRDGNEGRIKGQPANFINFKKMYYSHTKQYTQMLVFLLYSLRRMIADVLQEIQQYQNTPYCLKPEQSIQVCTHTTSWSLHTVLSQDYIIAQTDEFNSQCAAQGAADKWEDVLYDLSLEIEPRDGTFKKAVSSCTAYFPLSLLIFSHSLPLFPLPPFLYAHILIHFFSRLSLARIKVISGHPVPHSLEEL